MAKKQLTLNVLRNGALAMQACTNAKKKADIERLANQANLSGTANGWIVDEKESKRLNQAKVQCADDAERIHIILYC